MNQDDLVSVVMKSLKSRLLVIVLFLCLLLHQTLSKTFTLSFLLFDHSVKLFGFNVSMNVCLFSKVQEQQLLSKGSS